MNTNCCGYTTRSYDFNGFTIWSNNYWFGSRGTPTGVLRVCVDSAGNVYNVGDTALSSVDSSTWSIVSWDAAGNFRWRKDLQAMGRAFGYSTYTGNMWDVVCTDDDRIVCIGDRFSAATLGLIHDYSLWVFNPDGSSATLPPLNSPGYVNQHLLSVGNQLSTVPVATGGAGTPSTAAARRGTTKYLTDGGVTQTSAAGSWRYPTLVQMPIWTAWYPSYPTIDWGFWATRSSFVNDKASISTVAASRDASKVYCSGSSLNCVRGMLGIVANTLRLIPDIGYTQSADVGLAPVGPGGAGTGQDSVVWAIAGDPVRSDSVGIVGGVVMSGGGLPRIKLYADSNGSKVWAHNHQNVTGLAATSTRLVSTGIYQLAGQDVSFV